MKPATFNSINTYIDAIIRALENKAVPIEAKELKEIHNHMNLLVDKLDMDKNGF